MFLVVPIDESVHPDLGLLHGQKRFTGIDPGWLFLRAQHYWYLPANGSDKILNSAVGTSRA
jgi:hypothetical protein